MELYPHNQEAYNKAVKMFQNENMACINHPCGTGKSMIICQLILDNPDARHLLLAPGGHIQNEIKKHLPERFWRNLFFCTYVGANEKSKNSRLLFTRNAFDNLYIDEYHRTGPEFSGNNTRRLLEANPNAKILGTSATPIRYLDNFRNMATELFNNRIASHMTIQNAINTGLFPEPDYYSGRYLFQENFTDTKQNILSLRSMKKEKLFRELNSKMVNWEQSCGLDNVIKELVTPDRKRVIVFCKNLEHLFQVQEMLDPVFKSIYRTFRSLTIHSKFKASWNEQCLADFSREDNQAVVLYTVDMVNEGLHSRLCNTAILLRDTISGTIYYQQIGRVFSIRAVNKPLIIDVVNNCNNVRFEEFRQELFREMKSVPATPSKIETDKVKIPIEFTGEKRDLCAIIPGDRGSLSKEPERNASKEKIDKEVEACIDRLIAHFKEGAIDNMDEKLRADFTRIQFRCQQGGLSKPELTKLRAGRVPIDMSQREAHWIEKAQELVKWCKSNGRLPGIKESRPLYSFWLREERLRNYEHRCKTLFRANIVAERLYKDVHLLILDERGLPNL